MEMGSVQIARTPCGRMPRDTWGQCYDSLASNKKFHPTASSQMSSRCFIGNRARAGLPVPAAHRSQHWFPDPLPLGSLPSEKWTPKVSWCWGQEFMVMTLRCWANVTNLFHLG